MGSARGFGRRLARVLLACAAPIMAYAMCAPPHTLRVCTFGGEGKCSMGYGADALDALQFLSPRDGPGVTGCSCLARCDRGVAVQLPSGQIDEKVNGPRACAALLRSLNCTIDQRLVEAYAAAERGDELVGENRDLEALSAYKRAFSLAIAAGLGLKWRSAPSLQNVSPRPVVREPGATYLRGEPRGSGGAAGSRVSIAAAKRVTPAQIRWLARTLTSRSNVFSRLGGVTTAFPLGRSRPTRRALEDAKYAVELLGSAALLDVDDAALRGSAALLRADVRAAGRGVLGRTSRSRGASSRDDAIDDGQRRRATRLWVGADAGAGEDTAEAAAALEDQFDGEAFTCADPVVTGAWERLAETYEGARDIAGAIYAYERLLAYEPAFSPGLSPALSAKRGVQEIVLLSHRRGLEDALGVATSLQSVGESSRVSITSRAISDVETLRKVVERDCDTLEAFVDRLVQSDERLLSSAASRSLNDVRMLRKLARNDINRLELTLLRGDPLLAFLRDVVRRVRGVDDADGDADGASMGLAPTRGASKVGASRVTGSSSGGGRATSGGGGRGRRESGLQKEVPEASELVFRLREQFDQGALPRDPLLVRALLEQAKRDPQLVARLVTEAKDPSGKPLDISAPAG